MNINHDFNIIVYTVSLRYPIPYKCIIIITIIVIIIWSLEASLF